MGGRIKRGKAKRVALARPGSTSTTRRWGYPGRFAFADRVAALASMGIEGFCFFQGFRSFRPRGNEAIGKGPNVDDVWAYLHRTGLLLGVILLESSS